MFKKILKIVGIVFFVFIGLGVIANVLGGDSDSATGDNNAGSTETKSEAKVKLSLVEELTAKEITTLDEFEQFGYGYEEWANETANRINKTGSYDKAQLITNFTKLAEIYFRATRSPVLASEWKKLTLKQQKEYDYYTHVTETSRVDGIIIPNIMASKDNPFAKLFDSLVNNTPVGELKQFRSDLNDSLTTATGREIEVMMVNLDRIDETEEIFGPFPLFTYPNF